MKGHDKGVTLAMYLDGRPNAIWHAEGTAVAFGSFLATSHFLALAAYAASRRRSRRLWLKHREVVGEGANMPSTIEATNYFLENGVAFMPGKAANAGGVLVSGLEMSQNARTSLLGFEEVDGKLEQLMRGMFHNVDDTAKKYDHEAQRHGPCCFAGFEKVADAMIAQGVC